MRELKWHTKLDEQELETLAKQLWRANTPCARTNFESGVSQPGPALYVPLSQHPDRAAEVEVVVHASGTRSFLGTQNNSGNKSPS